MGAPAAMSRSSSEILYMLDPAQGICELESNIVFHVFGELASGAIVTVPFASHLTTLWDYDL